MISEISQSEKEKNYRISLIYGYKTEAHRYKQQSGGCQREWGGERGEEGLDEA